MTKTKFATEITEDTEIAQVPLRFVADGSVIGGIRESGDKQLIVVCQRLLCDLCVLCG